MQLKPNMRPWSIATKRKPISISIQRKNLMSIKGPVCETWVAAWRHGAPIEQVGYSLKIRLHDLVPLYLQ